MSLIPSTFPNVQGQCPACGHHGLFLGSGGYVTCSWLECPEPDAASTLLERPAAPTTGPGRVPLDHLTSDQLDALYDQLDHVRTAVHVADTEDVTDWQRGYRACSDMALTALNGPKEQPGA